MSQSPDTNGSNEEQDAVERMLWEIFSGGDENP